MLTGMIGCLNWARRMLGMENPVSGKEEMGPPRAKCVREPWDHSNSSREGRWNNRLLNNPARTRLRALRMRVPVRDFSRHLSPLDFV